MDDTRFDALTRALGASRRGLVTGLLGGLLAAPAGWLLEESAAKNGKKKKIKCKKPKIKCGKKCCAANQGCVKGKCVSCPSGSVFCEGIPGVRERGCTDGDLLLRSLLWKNVLP